jgi:hypothetical protein
MHALWPRLMISLAAFAAWPLAAQEAAPVPSSRAVKPQPKLLPPVAQAEAAAPIDLRPEQRVTPQLQAPIGRVPQPPVAEPIPVPTETLDQRLARCQAELGEKARADCRQRAELAPRR